MRNLKQITVDTYNNSAIELAKYFRGIGSRTEDIELAIELSGVDKPSILEIGCGDGRDAKEIIKLAGSYTGIDISEGLIDIAVKYVPNANFVVADAVDYQYGQEKYNIVFAFASFLHLDKSELSDVFLKVYGCLKPEGICSISLKLANKYTEKIKQDKFGTRIFYFYNPEIIKSLTSDHFDVVNEGGGFKTVGNTEWFEIVLRKK